MPLVGPAVGLSAKGCVPWLPIGAYFLAHFLLALEPLLLIGAYGDGSVVLLHEPKINTPSPPNIGRRDSVFQLYLNLLDPLRDLRY